MPVERISKGFKDVSASFLVSTLNYDLISLKNENAIARSLRNLVLTLPGERFFNENLGSNVSKSLFDNIDSVSASIIESEIENTIKNYEPRVNLLAVNVVPDFDNNNFDVTITYEIIGIDVLPQQLTFALQQTR
jgi:phage baseplate assembly protein W